MVLVSFNEEVDDRHVDAVAVQARRMPVGGPIRFWYLASGTKKPGSLRSGLRSLPQVLTHSDSATAAERRACRRVAGIKTPGSNGSGRDSFDAEVFSRFTRRVKRPFCGSAALLPHCPAVNPHRDGATRIRPDRLPQQSPGDEPGYAQNEKRPQPNRPGRASSLLGVSGISLLQSSAPPK